MYMYVSTQTQTHTYIYIKRITHAHVHTLHVQRQGSTAHAAATNAEQTPSRKHSEADKTPSTRLVLLRQKTL